MDNSRSLRIDHFTFVSAWPKVKYQVTILMLMHVVTGVEIEKEFSDRHDMNLPGHQLQVLQDAVQHSEYG